MRPENHRKLIVYLKGLEAILGAMREHPADVGIQTQACCVLANVCATNEIHEILSKSDCIEAVMNCQLDHRDAVRVKQAAMSFHDAMSRSASTNSAAAIAAFGGGEPVIEMLMFTELGTETVHPLEGHE